MSNIVKDWLALATRRSVVRRALITAAFVGGLLITINHGDALLAGDISAGRVGQMILTSMVPYLVSTFSSVGAIRTTLRMPSPTIPARDERLK